MLRREGVRRQIVLQVQNALGLALINHGHAQNRFRHYGRDIRIANKPLVGRGITGHHALAGAAHVIHHREREPEFNPVRR
jgi:hypothetical protein